MKRVVLKLSGEALAGEEKGSVYDDHLIKEIADQVNILIKKGMEICIVIGGGNYWRGRSDHVIDRCKSDQIGMLATVMNCIYVSEVFRSCGIETAILTPFAYSNMTEVFNKDLCNRYLRSGHVVFFAGGTGHPFFSTDTCITLRAAEMEADCILLAKNIDGVYDSDPAKNKKAVKYDTLTISEMVEKQLGVIDMTASVMCMENKIPLRVFALKEKDSIINAFDKDFNGTNVTID